MASATRVVHCELRSAMPAMVFAATVTMEVMTGNSVFRKIDIEGIRGWWGVFGCSNLRSTLCWFCSARNGVGRIFTVSCNAFIDSVIDQIVDGLFYEGDPIDWPDEP